MTRRNKASTYWERVAIQQTLANEKTQAQKLKELESYYENAKQGVDRELKDFYTAYGKDNKLDYTQVVRTMGIRGKEAYAKAVEQYTRAAKDFGTENMDPNDIAWLDEQSKILAVTRLEAFKSTLGLKIAMLGQQESDLMESLMSNIYQDNYYKGIFNIQQAAGVGFTFDMPDERTLSKIVGTRYNGKNYSDRIWANKQDLITNFTELLGQHFARGTNITTLSEKLAERMDVKLSYAKRLLRTEANYIAGVSAFDVYDEAELEQYEFVATLDHRTSTVCQDLDGKVFNVEDKQVGLNCHPMHPYCRSTTVAHFGDEWVTERIARNPDGKNIHIPSDMSYKDWATKYADPNYVETLTSANAKAGTVKGRQPKEDEPDPKDVKLQQEFIDKIHERFKDPMTEVLDAMPEDLRKLLLAAQEKGFNMTFNFKSTASHYTTIGNRVTIGKDFSDERILGTIIHELGHMIDHNFNGGIRKGASYINPFTYAINQDYKNFLDEIKGDEKLKIADVRFRANLELRKYMTAEAVKYSGLSDIYSAASKGLVSGAYGHKKAYWNKADYLKNNEVFANMFQMYAQKDFNDAWELTQEKFPQSSKEFMSIIKEMIDNMEGE